MCWLNDENLMEFVYLSYWWNLKSRYQSLLYNFSTINCIKILKIINNKTPIVKKYNKLIKMYLINQKR